MDHVQNIKESVEESLPGTTPFSFDDAFSDTDDIDPNIEFSSVAIRADLAWAASSSREDEQLAGAEESPGVGTTGDGDTADRLAGPSPSVYGILCHSTRTSPLCRDIPSPALDTKQLYAKFDAVSLLSPVEEKSPHVEDHDDVQNGLEATDDEQGQQHARNSGALEAQPAATNLEESHSDPVTPDASQESPPLSPPPSAHPPDTPTSGNELETHPGQTAHERSTSLPHLNPPSPGSSSPRPPSSGHKSTRSTGPSMLERVISKTRPSHLPPKSRLEDQKHLSDWERMMKQSRAAGTH